jgi:hypothetical protein
MRFRRSTLMIVLAVLPPLLSWSWFQYQTYCQRQEFDVMWDQVDIVDTFLEMKPPASDQSPNQD